MGMGVDKAGHKYLAGAIDDPFKFPGGAFCPHRSDLSAVYQHEGILDNRICRIHGDCGNVFK